VRSRAKRGKALAVGVSTPRASSVPPVVGRRCGVGGGLRAGRRRRPWGWGVRLRTGVGGWGSRGGGGDWGIGSIRVSNGFG
jgi:hypothetical protein